ncbi:LTA synthase family protein [Bombilactobacillus bombi]|uniref:LTA synthase family protein n=1 Tax=Bombilactobacillus bombi TaxID=1303590 RepID=UPI0015E60D93|nr:LTA synthase family protein [Bombilactobacillus bombi]MBA1434370.1 LTA synthase family protein [Bombilactobacillus bombi]
MKFDVIKKISFRVLQVLLVITLVYGTYFLLQLTAAKYTEWVDHTYKGVLHMINQNLMVTTINEFILLLLVIAIISIIGDYWIGLAISSVLFLIVGFVNYQKIVSRSEPLLPADLLMTRSAGGLLKMVSKGDILKLLFLIICIVVGSLYLRRLTRSYMIINHKVIFPLRAIIIFISIITFGVLFQSGDKNSVIAQELDKYSLFNNEHNQTFAYYRLGSALGFITNVHSSPMQRPKEYSEAEIKSIVKRYQKGATVKKENIKPVNIVYILNESLTNPQTTQKFYPISGQQPLTYINNILQYPKINQASGYMISPEYGGGTANIEFEANTGFSNYFLNNTPYQHILPKKDYFPSIMHYLNDYGYKCLAYHPYLRTMYMRPQAYQALGINQFKDEQLLKNLKKSSFGEYTTDISTYPNIYNQQNKSRQFSLVITMQNHMPYFENMGSQSNFKLEHPINNNIGKTNKMQTYLQELHQSDQAFAHLVQHFQHTKQKTIIVMYGDHYPGDGLYDNIKQKTLTVHATPFVMVANFPLKNSHVGYFSPNYMSLILLQKLGYPLTPFYNLLSRLYKEIPVLTKTIQMRQQNNKIHINTNSKTEPKNYLQKLQAYKDYQLIEYDMTYGKRYAQKYHFFSLPSHS